MRENKTILIVDDTNTNIDILLGLLEAYDVVVATDGNTAIKIANEEKIDLILLDIMMPDIDGFEVCTILKSMEKTKDIPVIFITAKTDEDSIEIAYDVGGVDYVSKPFKPKELLARVKTQLQMRSIIQNLEFLASKDSMTGIYNRRKFFELSQKLFDSSKELYAVMIDIDEFKMINDSYGHDMGDKVIIEVTKLINSYLFDGEIFGRLGGEEFAIISPILENSIKQRVENIREEIEKLSILSLDNEVIKITISIGVTKGINRNIKNLDYLLKISDDALYEAKNKGKNRIVFKSEVIS
jgi:diguanylate cyclase (GGDEF)-like protein